MMGPFADRATFKHWAKVFIGSLLGAGFVALGFSIFQIFARNDPPTVAEVLNAAGLVLGFAAGATIFDMLFSSTLFTRFKPRRR